MPFPIEFRRFSDGTQERIRELYFRRGLTFDEKVFQIGILVQVIDYNTKNKIY
jgi:hypothetical protein